MSVRIRRAALVSFVAASVFVAWALCDRLTFINSRYAAAGNDAGQADYQREALEKAAKFEVAAAVGLAIVLILVPARRAA